MKIILTKSVDLEQKENAWIERTLNGVDEIVIPSAILSTSTKDVQGDVMSESFLAKAFTKVKQIFVNEEHKKGNKVGYVENLKIEKNKVLGDIVVQGKEAIAKVKAGVYKALSIEGKATEVHQYLNARVIQDGKVNFVALTSNPANKDAFFAKSEDSDDSDDSDDVQEEVIVTKFDEDYDFAKSDTTAAATASTEPAQASTDTNTAPEAPEATEAVKPADEQAPAQAEPGQATQEDVSSVDAQALQVEIIKDLEAQLEEAKKKLEEKEAELMKSLEANKLEKSVQADKKKLESENYILKLSVANAKKAEEAHTTEIAELKKSLGEATAKIEEFNKLPVLKAGIHKSATALLTEDDVDDEFAKEYLVFDNDGNIDKKKTLAKALAASARNAKITD